MISHAQDLGTGFSACISVGNQADLEICDFVEYFLADPVTRAICLYVEALKDPRRFLELADHCREAGKPLLAVKAGRSEAGRHIAQSHTASLAGSYAVWDAVCRDRAVCVLDDPENMIQCADFLIRFGVPASDGVAALSPSGGAIAVAADRISAAGLRLAEFSRATLWALRAIVPAERPLNPLDIGGLPREQSLESALKAQELFARDPEVGVVFIVVATTPQLDEKVRRWGEAALQLGKPIMILLTPGSLVDGARAALREIGCPFTNRMDDALRVIRTAVEYGGALCARQETVDRPGFCTEVASFAADKAPGHLTEPETKQLLRAAGIASTADIVARSVEDAISAADRIGYPVVVKALSREVVHKSDIGAVKLSLADAQAVTHAWREIHENVARHAPQAALDGCIVQPMVTGGIEMIIGATCDPQFGAVVMVGTGGVWVEILKDVQFALAPVTSAQALRLIRSLRAWPLLDGARGRPRADTTALADVVARVSWVAATLGPQLVELDVNPLLVKAEQQGTIALDARATLAAGNPELRADTLEEEP